MNLLDRYILAVEQALPEDKKSEISRELRANLQDEIDAFIDQSETEIPQEDAVAQVLKKYGHPQLTARTFFTEPPLVSGFDMPLYKRVLSHGAAALFVYALLRTVVSMLQDESINPFRLIFQSIGVFIDGLAWLFLALTVAFYYIGKSYNLSQWQYGKWTIDSLPNGPLLKIKTSDTITDLISNSFILLILWTPLWMSDAIYQQQVLALAPSAEYWRIILTVLCVQSLLQALYRFTQSYWDKRTCLAYLGDLLLFAFANLFLAMTDPVLLLNPEIELNANAISRILENISQSTQYVFFSISFICFVLSFFQFKKYRSLIK